MASRFKILGRTQLHIDGCFDHRWGQPKLRGMLASLLLNAGRSVPAEELIEWVWPDGGTPADPISTLDSYASRTRKAMRRMTEPPRLTRENGGYRVEVEPREVDLFEFRAAVDHARRLGERGEHEQSVQVSAAALDLWTDRPLADLHGERAGNWRLWARTELWLPAHDILLHGLSALGRFDEVLRRLADLPAEDQANLSLVKRRLEAFLGQQRYRDATTYFLHMRKQLQAAGDHDEADELLRFRRTLTDDGSGPRFAPEDSTTAVPEPPRLLRHDVSDFVGREVLLHRLDALAFGPAGDPNAGVVAIDGPAGVGKTALIVHWAHRVAHRFPGGVLHADLSGFADGPMVDPDTVVDGFLAALGVPAEPATTTAGRAARLRGLLSRPTLVLLDNAFDSAHARPLLASLPSCFVLVTSRRKLSGLGRQGAPNVTVPPLDYVESKAWLSRQLGGRATREASAVGALAAMCLGNMLALRLVAQHAAAVPNVPLDDLVDELRDSNILLGLGDDGDGSDGSVRAVLSWSYLALGDREQRLFRLLGLHPGPDLSVSVAAALAGQSTQDAKRDLDMLVKTHLLDQPESRSRYRLHDLLRKLAAELVRQDGFQAERTAAAERMLDHYLHTANNADKTLFPYRPEVPVPPCDADVTPAEFTDENEALDWYVRERVNINSIIAFASENQLPMYAATIPEVVGEAFQRLGFHPDIVHGLDLAIQAARSMRKLDLEADLLSNLSHILLGMGNLTKAEQLIRAAQEKYREIGYDVGLAMAIYNEGRLHLERGQFERGTACFHQALPMLHRADSEALEVCALHRLGEAYRRRNMLDTAMSYLRDGLWLAERINDETGQGRCLTELGNVFLERGDLETAKGYCARALTMHQLQRDPGQSGKVCNLLAKIGHLQGDLDGATRHLATALRLLRAAGDPREEATARDTWAHVLFAQARPDDARVEWQLALTLWAELDDPRAESVRARLNEFPTTPPLVPATRTEPLKQQPRISETTESIP